MRFRFFAPGLLAACLLLPARAADAAARYQAIIDAKGRDSETVRVQELFKAGWELTLTEDPEFATFMGRPGGDHRWTDWSPEAIARRRATPLHARRAVASIDPAALGEIDRVSYELFKQQVDDAIDGQRFPSELLALNQMGGVQQKAARTFATMRNATGADLETQVTRLKALPRLIDQTIALLEDGLARGVTPPRITLRDVPQQVLNQIVDDPLKSPVLAGFASVPATVPEEVRQRHAKEATRVYREEVVPAWRRLHALLHDRYLPRATEAIAANALPDGAAWYAYRIRTQTTTNLNADRIHEIGLAEVARIRAEMVRVKTSAGFKG